MEVTLGNKNNISNKDEGGLSLSCIKLSHRNVWSNVNIIMKQYQHYYEAISTSVYIWWHLLNSYHCFLEMSLGRFASINILHIIKTHCPSSTWPTWLHELNKTRKVTTSGTVPSDTMSLNKSKALSVSPSWAYPTMLSSFKINFCRKSRNK